MQDIVDKIADGGQRVALWLKRYIFGNGADSLYDVRASVAIGYLLSIFLWWIPVLGQMVMGYVSGRKAGTPFRGMVCVAMAAGLALLSVYVFCLIAFGQYGFPGTDLATIAAAIGAFSPVLSSTAVCLTPFFVAGTSGINVGLFATAIAFGFVGGIMSSQARKEAASLMATGAVGDTLRTHARSLDLYAQNKTLGFKAFDDCITMQNMTVNANNTGVPDVPKEPPVRRTTSTVQTVTTTVSAASATRTSGPFSDILGKKEKDLPDEADDGSNNQ